MERPTIFYVYDVLCGWCYGFSPVIEKFWKEYQGEFFFKTLSGGMITGEREGPVGEVAGYIKNAYRDVEARTGVQFGAPFLNDLLEEGSAYFSSLPGALAMAAFRGYQPDNVIPFAARMQKAVYWEGKEPNKPQTFGDCAEDFGMNSQDFMKLMVDKQYLDVVKDEFKLVHQWGIQGFPSVLYADKDKVYLLARGYVDYQTLNDNLKKVREQV